MSTENNDFILNEFITIDNYIKKRESKIRKFYNSQEEFQIFPDEISYNNSFKIAQKYHDILKILLINPESNITEIASQITKKVNRHKLSINNKIKTEDKDYKRIERMVWDLASIQLIEPIPSKKKAIGNFDKDSIPYSLSLNGIIYMILNYSIFGPFVLDHLLHGYYQNALFETFLFPHFELRSLVIMPPIAKHSIVIYLQEICKLIIKHIDRFCNYKENVIEGHETMLLFVWPNQYNNLVSEPFEKMIGKHLIRAYLKFKFGWDWIDKAEIIPNFQENIISIKSKDSNIVPIIRVYQKERKVVLKVQNHRHEIFKVTEFGQWLYVTGKFVPLSESLNLSFRRQHGQKLVALLFDLRSYNISWIKHILVNDKKFKQSIQDIIKILEIKE